MLARKASFQTMSFRVSICRTSSSILSSSTASTRRFSSRGPRLSSWVMRMAFSSLAFSARRGARSLW